MNASLTGNVTRRVSEAGSLPLVHASAIHSGRHRSSRSPLMNSIGASSSCNGASCERALQVV